MYASLTSTSTSSESMSTMVQMPVRVKPPPAETGEIISPGCAALAITTPPKGARICMSSSRRRCTAKLRSATMPSMRARSRRACKPSRARRSRSRSARLARLRSARFPVRVDVQLRLANVDADLFERRLGGGQLRFAERQLGAGDAVVEHRQQLAFLDHHALFDEHFEHLAGGLRADGRLPPRHHVAAGVEHAVAGERRRGGAGGDRLHTGIRAGEQRHTVDPAAEREAAKHRDEHEPAQRTPPLDGRVAVDPEFVEKSFLVHLSTPSPLLVHTLPYTQRLSAAPGEAARVSVDKRSASCRSIEIHP